MLGKAARTSVVLPDCRGPVTTTTGNPRARRSTVAVKALGIMRTPPPRMCVVQFSDVIVNLQDSRLDDVAADAGQWQAGEPRPARACAGARVAPSAHASRCARA